MLDHSNYNFIFTKDSADIEKYIMLRNETYKKLNGGGIDISTDKYDKAGNILIAKKNK